MGLETFPFLPTVLFPAGLHWAVPANVAYRYQHLCDRILVQLDWSKEACAVGWSVKA